MSRTIPVGEELPPLAEHEPAPCRDSRHGNGDDPQAKRVAAGRFAVLNGFVDFNLVGSTRREVAVWLVLYRDTRDGTARTSYDDIARRTGLNRRNVGRALRSLEERGLVQIVHRGGLRRGVSRYRIQGVANDG